MGDARMGLERRAIQCDAVAQVGKELAGLLILAAGGRDTQLGQRAVDADRTETVIAADVEADIAGVPGGIGPDMAAVTGGGAEAARCAGAVGGVAAGFAKHDIGQHRHIHACEETGAVGLQVGGIAIAGDAAIADEAGPPHVSWPGGG